MDGFDFLEETKMEKKKKEKERICRSMQFGGNRSNESNEQAGWLPSHSKGVSHPLTMSPAFLFDSGHSKS